MNARQDTSPVAEAQVQALLDRIDTASRRRREAALDGARHFARESLQKARVEARARVAAAVRNEKARIEAAGARARAARQTRLREAAQARDRALLEQAWATLPGGLAALWQGPACRRTWTEGAAAAAGRHLGRGDWELHCPVTFEGQERESLLRQLEALSKGRVAVVTDENLVAGICLRRGLALLDATPEGLLARRRAIAADLLHVLTASDDAEAQAHG